MGVNDRGQVVGYLNQIQRGRITSIGVIGRNDLLIDELIPRLLRVCGALPLW
jgi:hypothetical protein